MCKPGQGILCSLKQAGRGVDLPLDALRQFQACEKALVAGLASYEGRDPAITYGMQSFTTIEMFGIALMTFEAFPAARRCRDAYHRDLFHERMPVGHPSLPKCKSATLPKFATESVMVALSAPAPHEIGGGPSCSAV
jgi:hypothetical protein